MSRCSGGSTKKSISRHQVTILATLDVTDKLKILLFEFIYFATKKAVCAYHRPDNDLDRNNLKVPGPA